MNWTGLFIQSSTHLTEPLWSSLTANEAGRDRGAKHAALLDCSTLPRPQKCGAQECTNSKEQPNLDATGNKQGLKNHSTSMQCQNAAQSTCTSHLQQRHLEGKQQNHHCGPFGKTKWPLHPQFITGYSLNIASVAQNKIDRMRQVRNFCNCRLLC